jgi:hypothetical protein
MATSITTIQSTDLITNSRADINNNFDSLLVNKIETDVLTTDSTFATASDSKIPSQLAVKQYVDAGGNVNASTTAKGIVEEATKDEVLAGTAVGTTGARLFINPSTLSAGISNSVNFGDGSDGDVTISSPTTITRDMFYNNLVVTDTLNTDGYRVFVKGTLSGVGTIANNNTSAGGAGSGTSTAGVAGVAKGSGPWKGVAGSAGGAGGDTSPQAEAGVAGIAGNKGVTGAAGGAGGAGYLGDTGGAGGAGGVNDTTKPIFDKFGALNFVYYSAPATLAQFTLTGAGGGGGGEGKNSVDNGAGGGGSGGSGGVIIIIAKTWAGNFTISATGAAGGDGGTRLTGNYGGGGGGAGGSGGTVIIIYGTKTWTGSYTLTGGAGGAGGAAGTGGTAGSPGSTGTTGVYYEYNILSLL